MYCAKPSLSQRSSNQRIVTRSPNHWCASSCRTVSERAVVIVDRRDGAEEDDVFVEEGGAGVLHATVGEAGDQHLSYFGKGKGWAKKALMRSMPLRVVSATAGHSSFARASMDLRTKRRRPELSRSFERSGGEGEEIGADWLRFFEWKCEDARQPDRTVVCAMLPFDTTIQSCGTLTVSVNRALRSG